MKFRRDFPFQKLMGWEVKQMSKGASKLVMKVQEDHLSPVGLTHGGVVFTLLDTAMGTALFPMLEPGEFCTTIEISVRYLKGISEGTVEVSGKVVARSGRVAHCEAAATVGGEPVASATGSFLVSKFRTSGKDSPTTG